MKAMTMYRPNAIHGFYGKPSLLSDFDRYFDSFFGDSFLTPSVKAYRQIPAVDIRENENAYLLDIDLPGYDEKDIEVNVEGFCLSIASKHQEEKCEEKKHETDESVWLLKERRLKSFSRSFKLPENANPETVTAEFKNGTLHMEIKKRDEAKKRAIPVNLK